MTTLVRPGVNVSSRASRPPRGAPTDTGVLFLVGQAQKGPIDRPVLVRNMTEFEAMFGTRQSWSTSWDYLDTAFHIQLNRNGLTQVYFARAVGPSATPGSHTFLDAGAQNSITVATIGPWAPTFKVAVIAGQGSGTVRLSIVDTASSVEIEESTDIASVADAVAWGTGSKYVTVTAAGANVPAQVAVQTLAGGNDDHANITDTQRATALALFSKDLGPGQVAYSNGTTDAAHIALNNHGLANNRIALLDPADTSTAATVNASADAVVAGATDSSYAGMFAGWHDVPGLTQGTTRAVPPSAIAAGLMAANDANSGNPNLPAAGQQRGVNDYSLDLRATYSDTDRQAMNLKGVCVFVNKFGNVELYGYRSLWRADDAWVNLGACRLRMAIQAEGDAIGEAHIFDQLDGQGLDIATFAKDLIAMLRRYYDLGALYGATPAEAFAVDVGPSVNTPTTLQNDELHAVLSVRVSPMAEMVQIEIVKVRITEPV